MRTPLRIVALAILLSVAIPATFAGARTRPPNAGQIRAAVRRAQHSRALWATINICNTRRFPNLLGIRGEMPSLGFAAMVSMNIQVDFKASSSRRFQPIAGAARLVGLGRATTGLHQGGASFQFKPHAGTLSGTITFEWKLGRKLLGRATRHTTVGHPQADFGDPGHFSAAQCVIS